MQNLRGGDFDSVFQKIAGFQPSNVNGWANFAQPIADRIAGSNPTLQFLPNVVKFFKENPDKITSAIDTLKGIRLSGSGMQYGGCNMPRETRVGKGIFVPGRDVTTQYHGKGGTTTAVTKIAKRQSKPNISGDGLMKYGQKGSGWNTIN